MSDFCESPDPAVTVFDIGGTRLRYGQWRSGDGARVRDYTEQATPSLLREPNADVVELRARLVRTLGNAVPFGGDPVAGISLGAALDHRSGQVYASAPLWGEWERPFNLREELVRVRPDVSWHLVNDVTAALLHYVSTLDHRGCRKIMLVTISSGIACRLIECGTGEIPVDGCGLQGEVGHLPSHTELAGTPVELVCDCGQLGHVSAFASGPGIQRMAALLREREPEAWKSSLLAERLEASPLFESALIGALDSADPVAETLLKAAVRPVAHLLTTALTLDPSIDRIGLTGGVATGLGEHYRRAIVALMLPTGPYLTGRLAPEWVSSRIAICQPGDANGMVGAGLAALNAVREARGEGRTR